MSIVPSKCIICNSDVQPLYRLGSFYLSQSFGAISDFKGSTKFTYNLDKCSGCGLVSSNTHPSLDQAEDKYVIHDLRTQSLEPEHHFNELIKWLDSSLDLHSISSVAAVTYKDVSLVEYIGGFVDNEFNWSLFFQSNDILSIIFDLQSTNYRFDHHDKFDLILVRHFLEHLPCPEQFISSLLEKLNNNGIIYIEVPSSYFLVNYSHLGQVWEEHCFYFTIESINILAAKLRLHTLSRVFDNGSEPLISVLLSRQEFPFAAKNNIDLSLQEYWPEPNIEPSELELASKLLSSDLSNVILFGAGHVGIKFTNFFGLNQIIKFIVDDNPLKCGAYSLATGLPVYSSSCLSQITGDYIILHPFSAEKIRIILENSGLVRIPRTVSFSAVSRVFNQ